MAEKDLSYKLKEKGIYAPSNDNEPWVIETTQLKNYRFKLPGNVYVWFDEANKKLIDIVFVCGYLYVCADKVELNSAIDLLEEAVKNSIKALEEKTKLKHILRNDLMSSISLLKAKCWVRNNIEIIV